MKSKYNYFVTAAFLNTGIVVIYKFYSLKACQASGTEDAT